ncbi:thiol:disulfide interchange protein DsbA/DsbL [Kitasatospora sp. NPDC088346]|uniref:thiol:disulfide interchange protein DsbA/DsbL n=1 Tax=Kitasatospora sp. NPDC088346 TaxID=3364073 RepID=UPI00380C24B8
MNSLLRSAVLLTVTTGLLGAPAAAALPDAPHEGAHTTRPGLPQPLRASDTHEAVEFFWYDCTHSVKLEEPLSRWASRHRGEVTLRRVPAIWVGSPDERVQTAHARLYYTLERLGAVDRLQERVFRAVHTEDADLTTEDRATAWAVRQGLDAAAFRRAYRSSEVDRAVAAAPELFARYRVNELPTVIVDGRYRTTPSTAGGVDAMPAELDRLIEQA